MGWLVCFRDNRKQQAREMLAVQPYSFFSSRGSFCVKVGVSGKKSFGEALNG